MSLSYVSRVPRDCEVPNPATVGGRPRRCVPPTDEETIENMGAATIQATSAVDFTELCLILAAGTWLAEQNTSLNCFTATAINYVQPDTSIALSFLSRKHC